MSENFSGKLELTWPNKDKIYIWDYNKREYRWVSPDNIMIKEVRILKEKSIVGDPNTKFNEKTRKWEKPPKVLDKSEQNLLVKGDNLLALKALEPEFTGKIRLIYIDPPFNTGIAYEQYDDGLEHSIWLSMMKARLEVLRNLLAKDGAIVVHIDYREESRVKLLMDEVFSNGYRNTIIVKRGTKNVQQQFETIDSLSTGHDSLLLYTKQTDTRFPHCRSALEEVQEGSWNNHWRGTDRPTMRYKLFGIKPKTGQWRWKEEKTMNAVKNYKEYQKKYSDMLIDDYYSMKLTEEGLDLDFVRLSKSGKPEHYIPPRSFKILSDVWMDVRTSGKITEMSHEKHEDLLFRVINWLTSPGDWVLDSFLGSGTTAATAHKLGRNWIGIELGEHAETLCLPRLKKVVNGKDQDGISNQIHWKGGGGFRYCVLGDSLFELDEDGIKKIMFDNGDLIEAICKNEGFKFVGREFLPKTRLHGVVNGKRFCHVAEELVTQDYVDDLINEIKEDETLVIYCTKKMSSLELPPNIEVKKIPKDVSKKFEFE